MSNWLLELGSALDWISPIVSTVQDIVNGPSHTFQIPRACGWSGQDLERLLRQHGIKVWGLMIPAFSDTLLVTVRQAQARWAAYVLERHGVPVEGRQSLGTGRPVPSSRGRAGSRGEQSDGDWIDRLGDLLWS